MRHLLLTLPALLSLLACGAPQRQIEFQQRMQSWIGRPWDAFAQEQGRPQSVSVEPDGSRLAVYHRQRTEQTAVTSTQVVNVDTGDRVQVAAGQNVDASRQQLGVGARTREVKDTTVMRTRLSCTITVRINAQGLIEKIDVEGNDCA
jgi:hypothetical protein